MKRAVIIGFSHMHVNEIALYLSEQPDFELVGIADAKSDVESIPAFRYTPEWNLNNVKENYCSVVYDDYCRMLEELSPDIAFILTENAQKPAVVEECAKRGVNVCIEKPMAVDLESALKIKASVEKYGITAVVNWPVAWRPYLHKLKAVLDSGVVGTPVKMRYINGHTGPLGKGAKHRGVSATAEEMSDEQRSKTWWHSAAHGGGVFLDICCYGCYFTKWLMGDGAKSAIAYGAELNTPFGDTADNFAAVVSFDDRMAVLEGTWTTPRAVIPSGPEVLCTEGVVVCTGGAENAPDVRAFDIYGNEIEIPGVELGDSFKNMPWHLAGGEDVFPMVTLEANVEMMAILDAVLRASKSGNTEKI